MKLRAHNNLVGRLIGKGGATIKKIMEDTSCTIFVSNINELNMFNMERTITVRGPLENVAHAEQKISSKLRQCWENDMLSAPQSIYGGLHPLINPIPPLENVGYAPVGLAPPGAGFVSGAGFLSGRPMQLGAASSAYTLEVVHIWVPNNVVGALIGSKGLHIRNASRFTGAHIRIESARSAENNVQQQADDRKVVSDNERKVTITGSDIQQYKVSVVDFQAQFWVFKRICEQNVTFFEDIRLCTEIHVPSKLVGRIIGKGGANVRELQRLTGAQVKIPED
ncbi:unnamed protein product, partial [Soboliphyme baturini]|uniref:KH domain-containing protein n=1 Tax=Soboliphyme baturini TaxID=241478 RepID=A0A183J773_9BILA